MRVPIVAACVSERTLNRLLVQATGLSFGRWRQQLHVILAIPYVTWREREERRERARL